MLRLAHISDCHLAPLPKVHVSHLMSKRLLGFANWHFGRHKIHDPAILKQVFDDILTQKPDHIAITGDLVNLGLPQEFLNASHWLEQSGSPDFISVVPGNHDSYVKVEAGEGFYKWSDYMRSDQQGLLLNPSSSDLFPYVRLLKEKVALVGLSSSVPTLPFYASGELGQRQIEKLAVILKSLKEKDYFRLILLHHPPLKYQTSQRRALKDADQLEQVLKDQGAELLVHGHNHKYSEIRIETRTGPLPVIGISSASSSETRPDKQARSHIFEILKAEGHWQCQIIGRGPDPENGQIRELYKKIL